MAGPLHERYKSAMIDPLVERARAGDAMALETLLTQIAPSVRRFGMRMCGNPHDADDALQDTLLTIATHLPEFEGRSSFTSWVFALTRSACARRRRGLKNQPPISDADASERHDLAPNPEERVSDGELATLLSRALDGLTEDYREVIQLRDVEGLTAPDAAAALGITVNALKSRLHRAREALREALRPALEPSSGPPRPGCPDVIAVWSRKLEDDLSAKDCAEIEKHVAGCAVCGAECEALRRALGACRRAAESPIDPVIQAQVREAVRVLLARSGV